MRKKLVLLMILAAALVALPALAQNFGSLPADQPNASFQSTSTMTGSGSSYSANPTLNSDGTAAYSNASYSSSQNSGPRRAKHSTDSPGEVETTVDTENSPLGDAVFPLLLFAGAFLIWRAARPRAVKE
jgi:hypothetical protein